MSRVSRIRLVARRQNSLAQLADEVIANDIEIENLEATRRALDHSLVLAVADRIWQARRVYLLGMRSAHAVALFLHFALRLLGRDSRLMMPGIGDSPNNSWK